MGSYFLKNKKYVVFLRVFSGFQLNNIPSYKICIQLH